MYAEDWDEPMISCIRWVSELVAIAGGDACFPELSVQAGGRERIVADATEGDRRQPHIIMGTWCGKKFLAGKGSGAARMGSDTRGPHRRRA